MRKRLAVPILALAAALGGQARATPLEELDRATVSRLEFGSFKLEVALTGIRDWPFPIEGAGVSYKLDPDWIEIVVAVKEIRADSFRAACAATVGRIREFLYVKPDGVAPMGRSHLVFYFPGPWRGDAREAASRALDASTRIRVDVVGRGTCRAPLVGAPVTFEPLAPQ
jgi:hypothetical protein